MEYVVTNAQGDILTFGSFTTSEIIDFSTFKTGVYLIGLREANGQYGYKRIVKQ